MLIIFKDAQHYDNAGDDSRIQRLLNMQRQTQLMAESSHSTATTNDGRNEDGEE